MYNIAVIGCGYMGQTHLEDIYLRGNICIYGVCDLNEERAGLVGKRYQAKHIYTNAEELIRKDEVDIVIIATYPSSHMSLLKTCIRYRKHVICEKPITNTLEEGKEFLRLVQANPHLKILVGHILRHNDTYEKVAKLIRDGEIGKPIIMRMVQNHNTPQFDKYLSLIRETSPIIDCGVHYVDVMRWFTGAEVINVSGVGARTEESVPDDKYNYGLMTVTLSDGSTGFYEAGWSHTIATDNTKEFIGPKGRIKITYQKDRTTHKENGNLIEIFRYPENRTEFINVPYHLKPTGAQLDYLIRMIEENLPANPSIEEVYKSFETVCKADESIRRNMNIE